ncbi:damage-specific DNA binding protein, putative [Trypanosoma brucei brucei TREU927]|uniref:DNA damage-binding protein 1 n=1 Tax=Trypanosoma brucei brucei (strain 927/4 GUTat10.1) TaxID=185431 RepID=Q586I3_TRYB2|nr:damage-specific DNA binding protein, putative [Trypanosoma brucei brucei TREU927]AAX80271.1 damage-specific DNA binding protein, putative [Trypanosoma brucei]AAZ12069.1 damage-specific DNA binding protein, putative [Trypanosoma brucei brucei TREU927]
MPFLASTTKPPTAVSGAVTGNFLGDGEKLVLLSRLNIVSLFRADDHSFEHVADFSLFASLRFVESLPLFDNRGCGRHVVFFLSVKQEVSVVAFERRNNGLIGMVTLFHGDVETYFHQGKINDASLCCSGVYRSTTGNLLPIVIFSIYRGGVIGFDVAAAISGYSRDSKTAAAALNALFPSDYVQGVLKKTKRRSNFAHGNFAAAEIDVRSIALDHRDGIDGAVSLLVLYADLTGKTHVSEYLVNFWRNADQRRVPKTQGRSRIPEALNILPGGDIIQRKGLLSTSVETNACLLHVVPDGFFILGPQLLNFCSWKSSGVQSGSSKNVTTLEVPRLGAYVEPVCCATLPGQELLILFEDGSYLKVSVRDDCEGLNSGKSMLSQSSGAPLRTIPKCVAVVGECCVVGSHMDHTLWMRWLTGESGVLVYNCGPVFDVTVAADGSRTSVIAGTGVGLNGGLSFVRSAVSVRQDIRVTGLQNVRQISVSEDTIIFSLPGYSRVCRYCVGETMVLEEIHNTFFGTEETLLLEYNNERNVFLQVTTAGLRNVWPDRGEYVIRVINNDIGHAHASEGLLVFSNPANLYVFCMKTLTPVATLCLADAISCLLVFSSSSLLVGTWGSCAVHLYELHDGMIQSKVILQCSATPCSMCVVFHSGGHRLLVGLHNGYVADVPISGANVCGEMVETMLTTQPVRLFNLESHAAVLCLGEIPLILIVTNTGFQLTGIDFRDVSACAIMPKMRSPSRYIFFSKSECALILGSITSVQKLNTDYVGLKATATCVKYMPWWNVLVLSIRRIEKDQVVSTMGHEVSNLSVLLDEPNSFELLENERCAFIDCVALGQANEWGSCGEVASDAGVVLIGTTFVFPDEQLSRSSRFMWCTVEVAKLRTEKTLLRLQGSKDVEGALQCCCIVPNYAGRVALGIGGCVVLYSWNAADATFVAEETIQIGTLIVRLIPVMQKEVSYIVASDARHSCFFVRIDTIQGSLNIVARDPELRGVMDCAILQYESRHDVCLGDDLFNFFCVSHVEPLANSSGVSAPAMPTKKLQTTAQYHMGDLITVMHQGSFAPCSVLNDVVPIPATLVRGVCGPQIVYGTSHGAFGAITPISSETFILLKGLEVSVASVVPPLGGFTHASFREVLRVGQERGASRNASFQVTNPQATELFNRRRRRCVPRGVCCGDVVEMFLTLSGGDQLRVVQEANQHVRRWFAYAWPTLEEYAMSDLDDFSSNQGDELAPDRIVDAEINSLLLRQALPTLSLTVEAVTAFIQTIQRIH